jgi:acetyl esterase/lipase
MIGWRKGETFHCVRIDVPQLFEEDYRMKPLSIVLAVVSAVGWLCATESTVRAEETYEITPDVVYGHKAGLAMTFDVIRPKQQNGAAVLFMMSGGWFSMWLPPEVFVSDQPPFELHFFRELVDKGYTLAIVRHGSGPQFKVPEAVADVRRAVRFVRANANKFGIDPDRIGVCGGSAGGHLSLMLGTTSDEGAKDAQDEIDRVTNRVAAVVAYFPPVEISEFLHMKDRFPALDFDPKLAESVSPLRFVTPDDAPTLLVHGDKDDLVKLDNSERILAELKQDNVPCQLIVIEGAEHGFVGEDGQRASKALVEWFDKFLTAPAETGNGSAKPAKSEAMP